MPYLWIPFILLPLAELVVFFAVADGIGVLGAIAACVAGAFLGLFLIQKEGLESFLRAQDQIRAGIMPVSTIFNGLCVIFAGFLFIFPGFITDIIAVFLLVPHIREKIRLYLNPHLRAPAEGEVLEGTYERVDEPPERLRRP